MRFDFSPSERRLKEDGLHVPLVILKIAIARVHTVAAYLLHRGGNEGIGHGQSHPVDNSGRPGENGDRIDGGLLERHPGPLHHGVGVFLVEPSHKSMPSQLKERHGADGRRQKQKRWFVRWSRTTEHLNRNCSGLLDGAVADSRCGDPGRRSLRPPFP